VYGEWEDHKCMLNKYRKKGNKKGTHALNLSVFCLGNYRSCGGKNTPPPVSHTVFFFQVCYVTTLSVANIMRSL
jgi:hypothetical protein